MKYLMGDYLGVDSHAALVSVHAMRIQDELPVVLAAILEPTEQGAEKEAGEEAEREAEKEAEKEAGYWGDALLEWFDKEVLPACAKGEAAKCIKAVGKCWVKYFEQNKRGEFRSLFDCNKTSWSVFLGVGAECCYAWCGNGEIRLLNLCFNRFNQKKLTYATEEMQLEFARLETGIGILLGTEEFGANLPGNAFKECLAVTNIESIVQIEKHLREAARETMRRGGKSPAAILMMVREG